MKNYDYNPETGEFYWTSQSQGIVGRYNPETRDNQVWLEGVERPNQVAVDWLTGNVYLSHTASTNLTVCSSAGLCLPLATALVIVTHVKLDPGAGLMFVAGYHSQHNQPSRAGGIYPYTMAAHPVEDADIIVTGVPTGLTLDTEMRRVFWTDFLSFDVNMCNYNGKMCSRIIRTSHDSPKFIAFFESKLFWISGDEGHLFSYDIVGQNLSLSAKLPSNTHSVSFTLTEMVKIPSSHHKPCSSFPCAGVCLLSGAEAECLTRAPSYTDTADSTDNVAKTKTNKRNGGTIALAVILAFAGVAVLSIIFYKCKAAPKTDLSLSFTNSSFDQPLAGIRRRQADPDQELSAVQVVRQGTTVGYDNPGFESPWSMPRGSGFGLYASESLDISSSDGIVCSGTSTPAMYRPTQDTASSIASSLAASSHSELNQRHFSVVDEEEDSPFCGRDQQRLIKK